MGFSVRVRAGPFRGRGTDRRNTRNTRVSNGVNELRGPPYRKKKQKRISDNENFSKTIKQVINK